MKSRRFSIALLSLALSVSFIVHAQNAAPQLGKNSIDEIIKAMTVEEKVKLVVGKGFNMPGLSMSNGDKTPDKLPTISGHTSPIQHLGIPSLGFADGPSGIQVKWQEKKLLNCM